MSEQKRMIRLRFNTDCFYRDDFTCRLCTAGPEKLEVHHITSREQMPNGGYVKENGITLCQKHHLIVETKSDYTNDELYGLIGSSYEKALVASSRL